MNLGHGLARPRSIFMDPAQDKPHQPEKKTEAQTKEPQFSAADAEGRSLSEDRKQHGETVDGPDRDHGDEA